MNVQNDLVSIKATQEEEEIDRPYKGQRSVIDLSAAGFTLPATPDADCETLEDVGKEGESEDIDRLVLLEKGVTF
jgi:hypothetical protein